MSNSGTDVFLARHRMANLEMEEAIQSIYPQLSIPYWNWVNDNSENDPLWDEDFLGQFDEEWDLDREFNNNFGLPDQSEVNSAQSRSNWDQYTDNLEGSIVHAGAHNWVGGFNGVMSGGNSPLDPVFYFHGMIDKLWQEWEEVNQSSSFQSTSLPLYTNPPIDPDDIVDSSTLKVWYAEDGEVLLDKYDTDGTEEYRYTGVINAEDDFVVKNGSNVTFTAGDQIVLGPRFQVESSGEFYAEVDPDVGNIAAKQRDGIAGRPDDVQGKHQTYSLCHKTTPTPSIQPQLSPMNFRQPAMLPLKCTTCWAVVWHCW